MFTLVRGDGERWGKEPLLAAPKRFALISHEVSATSNTHPPYFSFFLSLSQNVKKEQRKKKQQNKITQTARSQDLLGFSPLIN